MKIESRLYVTISDVFTERDGTFDPSYIQITNFKPREGDVVLTTHDIEIEYQTPTPGEIIDHKIAFKEAAMDAYCRESTAKMQAMQAEIQELKALTCDSPIEAMAQ